VASIPDSPEATETGGMLSFDTPSMRRTFDATAQAAQAEDFWRVPGTRGEAWRDLLAQFTPES
jgi:hypothetical protein